MTTGINGLGKTLTLLLLSAICVGCGATQSRRPPREPYAIEIVNRAPHTVRLHLGAEYLGDVAPGKRMRFSNLYRHEAILRYRFLPAETEYRRRISFTTMIVSVSVSEPGQAVLPIPPRFASLWITNRGMFNLRISIRGKPVGRLLPGDIRHFERLPAGAVLVEARDRHDVVHYAKVWQLDPRRTHRLEIHPRLGVLRLINHGGEAMELFLDGARLGLVPVGADRRFVGLRIGVYTVKTVGVHTKNALTRRVRLLAGKTTRWQILPAQSTVWFKNLSTEPVSFRIDNGAPEVVPAKSQRLAAPQRPGPHRLTARGTRSGRLLTREITLNREEVYIWQVLPLSRQLHVTNLTPETALLVVDGVPRGKLAPKGTRVIDCSGSGVMTIQARLLLTQVVLQRRFRLQETRRAEWRIRRTTANLLIHNRLPKRVLVSVRGRKFGYLNPGQSSWFQIAPGRTRVRLQEQVSNEQHIKDFTATNDGRYRWVVDARSDGIRVFNRTGEPLSLFVDGRSVGDLSFRESLTVTDLLRGVHRLSAVGRYSHYRYLAVRWLSPRHRVLWQVEPMFGYVKVRNLLLDAVDVRIRGRVVGRVDAGQHQVFKLRIGLAPIEARRTRTGEVRVSSLIVKAVEMPVWELKERSPRLNVINDTQEPLDIRMDGKYLGRVERGRAAAFHNLLITRAWLTAYGLESGARYETVKQLRGATHVVWRLLPAKGTIRIKNHLHEAVRVRFRYHSGETIVPAQTTRTFVVPVGWRIVMLHGVNTRRYRKLRLLIAEGHNHHLSHDGWDASVLVINRHHRPLRVYVADTPLGWVPAGKQRLFRGVAVGRTMLMAISPKGRYRITRRLNLLPHQATWRIPPLSDPQR